MSLRDRWIDWIREHELQELETHIKHFAQSRARLLEVGGGNGFQAKRLSRMGFEVTSIDPLPCHPKHFDVLVGDSMDLAFGDNSFDVVFSSNVLEHIPNLTKAFSEMNRVLEPSGIMIHVVPTNYSTIYTFITQPAGYLLKLVKAFLYVCQLLYRKLSASEASSTGKENAPPSKSDAVKMLHPIRILIPWPHGTSATCFSEMQDWKPERWIKTVEKMCSCHCEVVRMPLAYSRHRILPFILIGLRHWLAKQGGASCVALIIRRKGA